MDKNFNASASLSIKPEPVERFKSLIERINKIRAGGKIDLSMEEDLSIAVMNLIGLEEHFFFTAEKTKKDEYFDLLFEIREIRKKLLGKLIDKHEGETWCITKHLLASTMRIIEVGTKLLADGNKKEAKETFDLAYKTYSLFWGIRLKLINLKDVKKIENKGPMSYEDIINKLVDCCKE